ncbi:MAG: glycosyltransferase family 2 protein [Candidatus Omnitrophota bacterium]
MKVELYTLNYNGKELLSECLLSLCEASQKSIYKPKVFVVDNKSSDGSREFVRDNFPGAFFREMKENRVLFSFNDIAGESDADILFFLNNDIKADKNFVDPVVETFIKNPQAFMVSPKFYKFNSKELECIWFKPQFKLGVFRALSAHKLGETQQDEPCYTFQSGMAAYNRRKFLELGGFDDIYSPGRIEESDLCFRAWKKGYKCYYQPKSVIFHKETISFNKAFDKRELLSLSHRNVYIFTWKNITSPVLLFKHFLFLIPRFLYAVLTFKFEIIQGFLRALLLLPRILDRRRKAKAFFLIPDNVVFNLFTGKAAGFF